MEEQIMIESHMADLSRINAQINSAFQPNMVIEQDIDEIIAELVKKIAAAAKLSGEVESGSAEFDVGGLLNMKTFETKFKNTIANYQICNHYGWHASKRLEAVFNNEKGNEIYISKDDNKAYFVSCDIKNAPKHGNYGKFTKWQDEDVKFYFSTVPDHGVNHDILEIIANFMQDIDNVENDYKDFMKEKQEEESQKKKTRFRKKAVIVGAIAAAGLLLAKIGCGAEPKKLETLDLKQSAQEEIINTSPQENFDTQVIR